MNPPPQRSSELAEAVALAARRDGFLDALGALLEAAERAVAATGAVCRGGGACCRFDLASHRLWASTGEVALGRVQPPTAATRPLRCPYQQGPRCIAHRRRPLGCRTYFCRPGPHGSAEEVYEPFHRQIRHLHARLAVPYLYMEWTSALHALGAIAPSPGASSEAAP